MTTNADFIRSLFQDIATDGFAKKFEDALADDLVWVATVSSPVSGEYQGKQVYLEKPPFRPGFASVRAPVEAHASSMPEPSC